MIESFWGVYCAGVTYRLDEANARLIIAATERERNAKTRDNTNYAHFIEVEDIFGATVFIDLKCATSIYSSSPATREEERVHTDYLNTPEKGFD